MVQPHKRLLLELGFFIAVLCYIKICSVPGICNLYVSTVSYLLQSQVNRIYRTIIGDPAKLRHIGKYLTLLFCLNL